jgi:hypothetical protein
MSFASTRQSEWDTTIELEFAINAKHGGIIDALLPCSAWNLLTLFLHESDIQLSGTIQSFGLKLPVTIWFTALWAAQSLEDRGRIVVCKFELRCQIYHLSYFTYLY